MTAEELLAAMAAPPEEEDGYCTIDPETRVITIPPEYQLLGVESDEKAERIYFKCPKIVGDDIDLSKLALRVNFRNAGRMVDQYRVDDIAVDGDNITFSWLLSRRVTQYEGDVNFIVCAVRVHDDATITNEWNTTIATATVLEGLEVDYLPDEEEQARDLLKELILEATKQIEDKAEKTLATIPEDYTQLQEDVDSLSKDIGDIATVGENLFNLKGTRYLNSSIDNNGDIVSNDGSVHIVYELPIKGGTYVSNMPTIGVYKISCISKDGVATIVTPSTTSDFEEHFTVPSGTVKVYMSFWDGRDSEVESADYIIFKKGMIVSGKTLPSEYIPYYKNLNNDIKVNESNIKNGTNLNKYIDTKSLGKEVSNSLFNETSNLIDSDTYLRGTLSTSGVFVESSDSTSNYVYTIKIPDATFIGMNAVPQVICFYDENMGFLESKPLAATSDDTVSINIPDNCKYAKLSYWYGRGVDGSFEHVTHLKDISVTVDSVPFQKIDKQTILSQNKKISVSNLCDGFELNSRLAKGIKWYILGDSRSVDLAYTAKFYHDYLCEKHKFVRKKNLAVSGARIRSADAAYHSLLEQYPNVEDDADLITIYAGINDYGQDNPTEIGIEGSKDLTTFHGAFESLITNLITNHSTAKIVVITPIPQYNFEINNNIVWGDRNDTNALGNTLDDYCDVIKKICRKYGVFVKDACYESGITPRIASQRSEYFKDGLHHNEKGQLVLANYLSDIFDLLDC